MNTTTSEKKSYLSCLCLQNSSEYIRLNIMSIEGENLDNLRYAFDSLPGGIQSEAARISEVEYRLEKLQDLVDSGEWEVDGNGNVTPVSMSDEHKEVVLSRARFSIIDQVPLLEGVGASQVHWHAVGSIICGENVIYSGNDSYTNIAINGSTVTNSTFRIG